MAAFIERKDRKIIPRWRPFRLTAALGELSSQGKRNEPTSLGRDYLATKIGDWRANKTLWHATDLIGVALVLGRPEAAVDAAEFILANESSASAAAREVARAVLTPGTSFRVDPRLHVSSDRESLGRRIHVLRLVTRAEPLNAIAWTDLALAYTIAGEREKAEHAIGIAVKLSPTNRFVLRCAARFHVHNDDPTYAHRLLTAADSTPYDPWLLAAEVAVGSAARRKPIFVKRARGILEDKHFAARHLSELASALGTLELESGKQKTAARLFRGALNEPTENSVAQAEWASNYITSLDVSVRRFHVPHLFEASAWESFVQGDWNEALANSVKWLDDQPFSSRPVILSSYLASTVLDDHKEAEGILLRGLVANPSDPTLLNNLAFSYASMGRIGEAEKALARADPKTVGGSVQVALLATSGLVLFRKGMHQEGRKLYLAAIEKAAKLSLRKHQAIATIYLAQEEMRAKSGYSTEAFDRAVAQSRGIRDPDALLLLKRLKNLYEFSDHLRIRHN